MMGIATHPKELHSLPSQISVAKQMVQGAPNVKTRIQSELACERVTAGILWGFFIASGGK
jgi:hypothetical protein